MAFGNSTLTVQNVIDYARLHTKLVPLVGIQGMPPLEPSLTFANSVMRKILNQPYAWIFNRVPLLPFNTVDGTDEYRLIAADFGWLERGYLERTGSTSVPPDRRDLRVQRVTTKDFVSGDPERVGVDNLMRSGAGVVAAQCLRFRPVPMTTIWTVYLDYQKAYRRRTALTDRFDPIPDSFEDAIKALFLSYAYDFIDDQTASAVMMRKGESLLNDQMAYEDPGDDRGIGLVPERSLFLG